MFALTKNRKTGEKTTKGLGIIPPGANISQRKQGQSTLEEVDSPLRVLVAQGASR